MFFNIQNIVWNWNCIKVSAWAIVECISRNCCEIRICAQNEWIYTFTLIETIFTNTFNTVWHIDCKKCSQKFEWAVANCFASACFFKNQIQNVWSFVCCCWIFWWEHEIRNSFNDVCDFKSNTCAINTSAKENSIVFWSIISIFSLVNNACELCLSSKSIVSNSLNTLTDNKLAFCCNVWRRNAIFKSTFTNNHFPISKSCCVFRNVIVKSDCFNFGATSKSTSTNRNDCIRQNNEFNFSFIFNSFSFDCFNFIPAVYLVIPHIWNINAVFIAWWEVIIQVGCNSSEFIVAVFVFKNHVFWLINPVSIYKIIISAVCIINNHVVSFFSFASAVNYGF